MRIDKTTPNQDDARVLVIGFALFLGILFIISPMVDSLCYVEANTIRLTGD